MDHHLIRAIIEHVKDAVIHPHRRYHHHHLIILENGTVIKGVAYQDQEADQIDEDGHDPAVDHQTDQIHFFFSLKYTLVCMIFNLFF